MKTKYFQLLEKDGKFQRLVSASQSELDKLTAQGWTAYGFDNSADIPKRPIVDGSAVREMTAAELQAQAEATAQTSALAKSKFTKLQIRRAMRSLGNESELDSILATSQQFQKDWNDAIEIDLNDATTAIAMQSMNVDIDAIKLKIAEET